MARLGWPEASTFDEQPAGTAATTIDTRSIETMVDLAARAAPKIIEAGTLPQSPLTVTGGRSIPAGKYG